MDRVLRPFFLALLVVCLFHANAHSVMVYVQNSGSISASDGDMYIYNNTPFLCSIDDSGCSKKLPDSVLPYGLVAVTNLSLSDSDDNSGTIILTVATDSGDQNIKIWLHTKGDSFEDLYETYYDMRPGDKTGWTTEGTSATTDVNGVPLSNEEHLFTQMFTDDIVVNLTENTSFSSNGNTSIILMIQQNQKLDTDSAVSKSWGMYD